MDERTVQARIQDGKLQAFRDGKVCRIDVDSLVAYRDANREIGA
jgi:hypothetical protein